MREYIYGPPPPPPAKEHVLAASSDRTPGPLQRPVANHTTGVQSTSHATGKFSLNQLPNGSQTVLRRPMPTPYSRPAPAAYSSPRDPPKKTTSVKQDGDLTSVPSHIVSAASDIEAWIAQRRKNWPSAQRVAEKQRLELLNATPAPPPSNDPTTATTTTTHKKPCKYFSMGTCKNGTNCTFAHVVTYKRFEAPKQGESLFKQLAQRDMAIENETVLDLIVYMSERGMLATGQ